MNLIILLLIGFITTVMTFAVCGVGGGLMMLVALNGFSESDATPILILFALMIIGISIVLSTATSWIFIKARHAETIFRFWRVAGINAGMNILIILITFAIVAIMRL
jgi:hypothetical protein